MARAVSPELAYRIGQEFKENKILNQTDNGNRPEEQSLQHLLAHAILGAATSYATGNDITTGALAGATSEKTALILASYLYGKDPKELTQEQKDTVASIITLVSTATTYGATGDTSSAVNAGEVGKVGIEGNAYVPLSAMQGKTRAEVKRLYNSNISYFNANCVKSYVNCNSIIDHMIKFADNDYVALNYPPS